MKQLSKQEKLEKILEMVNTLSISVYKIAKKTSITQTGIANILNKKVKNPNNMTVNTLYDYLISLDNSTNTVSEPTILYNTEIAEERAFLTNNYQELLKDLEALLTRLEKALPDVETLKQRRESLELKGKIQKDLEALK